MNKFIGMGVAMVTPFDASKKVDFKGLEKLTNYLIDGGVDYLVVQGTTGESATLSKEEKRDVLLFIQEVNKGRKPIVLGVGGNNTGEVVKSLEEFDLEGVDAVLSVSPYYNKPSQEGIYQHYKAVAEATELPVILYNVPSRTSSNMVPETVFRLANDFKHIIGVKEAGTLSQTMKIIAGKPDDFLVISGDDEHTLPMLACGGSGVISVIGNGFPKEFSDMVHLALRGDTKAANDNHYALLKLIDLIFADGNPGGIKEVLKFKSICSNFVRLPLVPVNEEVSKEIYNELRIIN